MYLIEENLNSSTKDKTISAIGTAIIMSLFFLLLTFLTIGMPDPPIISKQGALELDFGYVDGGFGEPDQGGPSETPPELGGETGGATSNVESTPPPTSLVTTRQGAKVRNLPNIKTSKSEGTTTKKTDSRLDKLKNRSKGSGSASKSGNPNGWEGGRGTEGTGGGSNSGIEGDGGERPGAKGTGGVYANFKNFTIKSSNVRITADGRGKIRCSVKVECDGSWSIVKTGLTGTTYTGRPTDGNYRSVFSQAMRGVKFTKTGNDCPETRTVTADIQPE